MQFCTVYQRQTGSERYIRATAGRGEFFAFDYEVSHDPASESLDVVSGPHAGETVNPWFWPNVRLGTAMGCQAARGKGMRLCCSSLLIHGTRDQPGDTNASAVQTALAEFVRTGVVGWSKPVELRAEWLTSDVIALARGIHANSALDGLPALTDALLEAGCDDPLPIEHLKTCPYHGTSCWVVEMICAQAARRG